MLKKILLVLFASVMTVVAASDKQLELIRKAGDGIFKYNGGLLVDNDFFDRAAGEYSPVTPVVSPKADSVEYLKAGKAEGLISGGKLEDNIIWAREVAVAPGRAEITWAGVVPAGDYGLEKKMFRYVFAVPCEVLKGVPYEYFYGMHRSGRPKKSGTFTGKEPENKIIIGHIRHLKLGGKLNMLIDFNPCGPWGVFMEDPSEAYKAHLMRKGDHYYFISPFARAGRGGRAGGKVVILSGYTASLEAAHPVDNTSYTWPWPTLAMVQFTPGKPVTGFKFADFPGYDQDFLAWQKQPFKAESGKGWIKLSAKAKVISPNAKSAKGPIFSGGVAAKGAAQFRVNLPDALVLVNCMVSGKGEIRCGDRTESFNLAGNNVTTVTIPVNVKNKTLDIAIDGEWRLSGIVVQLLMFANEDYLFDRNWWMLGKAPWEYSNFANRAEWAKYFTCK